MLVGYSDRARRAALRDMQRAEREAQTRADEAAAVLEAERRETREQIVHDARMRLRARGSR